MELNTSYYHALHIQVLMFHDFHITGIIQVEWVVGLLNHKFENLFYKSNINLLKVCFIRQVTTIAYYSMKEK